MTTSSASRSRSGRGAGGWSGSPADWTTVNPFLYYVDSAGVSAIPDPGEYTLRIRLLDVTGAESSADIAVTVLP